MFGCQRKVWNELLAEKIEYHKKYKRALRNYPSSLKKQFAYLEKMDSVPLSNTQKELEKAWIRNIEKGSYPKFIPKGREKKSYVLLSSKNNLEVILKSKRNNFIFFGKIGWLKFTCHQAFPEGGKILHARLSNRSAGYFHISICFERNIEVEQIKKIRSDFVEGLDYSQTRLAVSSSKRFDPKGGDIHWYRKLEERLALEQKRLSSKKLFSKNWWKQKEKLAKVHARAVFKRNDFLHKYSHSLASFCDAIAIENLNMKEMAEQNRFGKNVMDNGWGKLRKFLTCKMEQRGKKLVVVSKYFPSSRKCNFCGYVNNSISLDDRMITCPSCLCTYDRDLNAAKNIREEGIRLLRTGGPPGIARWNSPSGS